MTDPSDESSRQRNQLYQYRGKYERLHRYLRDRQQGLRPDDWNFTLTFEEIEGILGFSLPKAARTKRSWWRVHGWSDEHTPDCHCHAWGSLNLMPQVDFKRKTVRFGFFVW